MSKMGISTAQSYCGAQIFEAVGLGKEVIDKYFTGTPSRVGGIGLDVIADEVRARHDRPSPNGRPTATRSTSAANTSIAARASITSSTRDRPQAAIRLPHRQLQDLQGVSGNWSTTSRTPALHPARPDGICYGEPGGAITRSPVPIDEVESVETIMKRFKSGAMSYGSISKEAHETLAIAMNRIGGKSNTGEGGEDPSRYTLEANGDSKKQRHQAGGLRALRRHQRISGQRQGTADQDGPGRQARRRRPAARQQGLSLDRQGASIRRRAWA